MAKAVRHAYETPGEGETIREELVWINADLKSELKNSHAELAQAQRKLFVLREQKVREQAENTKLQRECTKLQQEHAAFQTNIYQLCVVATLVLLALLTFLPVLGQAIAQYIPVTMGGNPVDFCLTQCGCPGPSPPKQSEPQLDYEALRARVISEAYTEMEKRK